MIASRIGALAQIVEHLRTGLLFKPHHAPELAAHIRWIYDHPAELLAMGEEARSVAASRYDPETNYRQLISVYEKVVPSRSHQAPAFDSLNLKQHAAAS